jgi:hypothetical protein
MKSTIISFCLGLLSISFTYHILVIATHNLFSSYLKVPYLFFDHQVSLVNLLSLLVFDLLLLVYPDELFIHLTFSVTLVTIIFNMHLSNPIMVLLSTNSDNFIFNLMVNNLLHHIVIYLYLLVVVLISFSLICCLLMVIVIVVLEHS